MDVTPIHITANLDNDYLYSIFYSTFTYITLNYSGKEFPMRFTEAPLCIKIGKHSMGSVYIY